MSRRPPAGDGRRDDGGGSTRRRLLAVLGVGAAGATGAYLGGDQLDSLMSGGGSPSADDVSRETSLDVFGRTHRTVVESLDSPADNYRFDYATVDVDETVDGETLSAVATPAATVTGDRLAVSPPSSGPTPASLADSLLHSWGVDPGQTVTTATAFGSEHEFRGGAGVEIAAAATVGTVPELGSSAMLVRAPSVDAAERLAERFEQLTR